jgi:hypothetical protein
MLKKLVVPFFSLAIASFGCSSSTTNTGTGGSGGAGGHATGGTTGSGGTSATGGAGGHATGGAGGTTTATGGAGGQTATGGAGGVKATGGAGGQTATGGAGGHATGGAGGATADAGIPQCTVTDATGTDVLSASAFCANLFAFCSNVSGLTLPTSEQECEDIYSHSGQEHCRSYHLCWGVEGITMDGGVGIPMTHCPHTLGMKGVCTAIDASAGN